MTSRTLTFRVGTHATFQSAMHAALDAEPELARLRARDAADPALALMDAWAVALDVLAFYQERIAVEGYLATATETGSVRELAATVGYRPAPGLAAGCLLAFTLEDGPGAPDTVTLPTGLKVQSLPGPGEVPQTYETETAIEARPAWNALRPQQWAEASPGPTELFLPGVVTDLRAGDALLFTGEARESSGSGDDWALRFVDAVSPLAGGRTTRVGWSGPLPIALRTGVFVYALRQRAAVFGHNAPDFRSMPLDIQEAYQDSQDSTATTKQAFGESMPEAFRDSVGTGGAFPSRERITKVRRFGDQWPRFSVAAPSLPGSVDLDTVYPSITEGGWAVLTAPGIGELFRIDRTSTTGRADFTLTAKVTRVALHKADLVKLFGGRVRETVVFAGSQLLTPAPAPVIAPVEGRQIPLAGPIPPLPAGRAVIATGRRAKLAVAEDAFDVRLRPVDGSAPVALLAGEVLTVTGASADGGSDGSRTWPVLRADGTAGTVTAPSERVRAVPAADGETEVSEPTVTAAPAGDDMLVLLFPLVQAYDRGSVRFAANVAPGSHGETRTEVLGSGDASTTLQSFTLTVPPDPATGRAPLTYVRSTVPGGATSTLSVVVDGLAWQEVPSLLDAGSRDRVYVVGLTADGRIQVSFGDGVTGARLPTGSGNVTATYRVGTGLAGSVPADRITLLLTRPLGVRSVTNPLPAGLAEDPETADVTRRMVPRTAVSLDRVVSLADYTDAARSFAGIAKAVATWAWDGRTRLIRITVAGAGGRAVDDATRKALVASLIVTGDPFQRISVIDHLPQPVDVTTIVIAAPGQQTTPLQAAVTAALADTFSFDRRDFDQPITAAEVAAVIQAVPGVQGVSALTVTSGSTQETPSDVASGAAPGATGAATLATVRTLRVSVQGAS